MVKRRKKRGLEKGIRYGERIADKSTEVLSKESVKPVTELGRDISKTINYGMKKESKQ